MTYEMYNAENILKEVEKKIKILDDKKYYKYFVTREVYSELSIFDWWNNRISRNHLKQMRSFLKTAIKLGYKGYACFKVGASGCANGMWVHTEESTDGFSPDCDCIYHSFTPDYTRWDVCVNGKWVNRKDDKVLTLKDIKEILKKEKGE